MFYLLWGRLSYNPTASEDVWMTELRSRFGDAAADVSTTYHAGRCVVSEIAAAHLADPNMYIWPEINPGGLIADYKDVLPSDQSFIASPAEAARNVVQNHASAKQGPHETAELFDGIGSQIEAAVSRAGSKLGGNQEWRGTELDLRLPAF
ncbi:MULTISPECIES: hypothetical protein [Paraburkholderia]|jgi:hypothetical protein|uniref:hypothetical protein n=1 Tax=Paraburkholderia TaxID=1822464 RepID=UPI0009419FB7|nr:hypothetical protein [Paraburkholderia phenazinium]